MIRNSLLKTRNNDDNDNDNDDEWRKEGGIDNEKGGNKQIHKLIKTCAEEAKEEREKETCIEIFSQEDLKTRAH